MQTIMIDNRSSYSFNEVLEYIANEKDFPFDERISNTAGNASKLNGLVEMIKTEGIYYDKIVINDKKRKLRYV